MRIAIVADIHGNLPALEAVVRDIGRRGVDAVVNLGDSPVWPLLPLETAAISDRPKLGAPCRKPRAPASHPGPRPNGARPTNSLTPSSPRRNLHGSPHSGRAFNTARKYCFVTEPQPVISSTFSKRLSPHTSVPPRSLKSTSTLAALKPS